MWCAALVSGLLLQAVPPAVAAPVGDAASATWTFERVRERVLEEGVGLREARFRLQRANLGLQDARNTFYPSINVTGGMLAGTIEDRDPLDFYVGVRASPILEGYEKFFARRLATLEVRAGRLAESEARELLLARARQAYLNLLATARARVHLETAVSQAQRLVEIVGAESEPDLAAVRQLEASLVLQRERMGLRALDDRRALEELALKTLLGLAPGEPFAIDTAAEPLAILPPTPPASAAAAVGGDGSPPTPRDSREVLGLEIARQQLRAARFERYPQPFLRLGLSRGGFEMRSGAYVFAGIDLPLFDWGLRQRQRARAAVEVAEKERELERARIERRAELARVELQRAAVERQQEERGRSIDLLERRLQAQLALYQKGRAAAADLARTKLELAHEQAELATTEGAVWAALCQREALQRTGVESAP